MSIFETIKNLFSGVELPTDLPVVGDIQEHITNATEGIAGVTEGLTDQAGGVVEQGQTVVEDVKNQLGL